MTIYHKKHGWKVEGVHETGMILFEWTKQNPVTGCIVWYQSNQWTTEPCCNYDRGVYV